MSADDILKFALPLFTGIVSIVIAVWSALYSRSTQHKLAAQKNEYDQKLANQKKEADEKLMEIKNKYDKRLADFNSTLLDKNAEKKAQRDYQYEARKRLYQECEPLLFQMMERSEEALRRIYNLAKACRGGNLESQGWLSSEGYYLQSMLYRFFSPLVFYSLLRKRMTSIDLSLDPRIKSYYQLTKALYTSFGEDFELAKLAPAIPYDPDHSMSDKDNPSKYYKQGMNWGQLDRTVDALIVYDPKIQKERCKSFSEFVAEYNDSKSDLRTNFAIAREMFFNFHPQTKPVLWRLLILQAHFYRTFLESVDSDQPASNNTRKLVVKSIPASERNNLLWLSSHKLTPEEKEKLLNEPCVVAEQYLRKNIPSDMLSLND